MLDRSSFSFLITQQYIITINLQQPRQELTGMTTKNKSPNKLLPIVAGCIAGSIEATCVWPMEFIKTSLQLNAKGSKLPYTGVISGLVYTVKTTGK